MVTIRSQTARAEIGPATERVGELVKVPISVTAFGLTATGQIELQDWAGGPESLVTFFGDMATDWRGWTGRADWADHSGVVALSAVHNGVSEVLLTITINPSAGWEGDGSWSVSIALSLEPGSLEELATSLRELFDH